MYRDTHRAVILCDWCLCAAELCACGVERRQLAGAAQGAATGILYGLHGFCGHPDGHWERVSGGFSVLDLAIGWPRGRFLGIQGRLMIERLVELAPRFLEI